MKKFINSGQIKKGQCGALHPTWKGGYSTEKQNACVKKWREANPDKVRAGSKRWRLKNPEKWKVINRLARHKRRSLTKICSTEWINKVKVLGNLCQKCGKTEPEVMITIDHIVPVSKGGTNHIDNLQPLCLLCNKRKSNKME